MEEKNSDKFLGKKTHMKKPVRKSALEVIDIDESKKRILEELKNNTLKEEQTNQFSGFDFQKPQRDDTKYYNDYNLYITESFNQRCISLVVSFIQQSQNVPDEIRLKGNLFKQLINIVKQLMMNEYEIILFTLYIDELGWENAEFQICENLFYVGILTKLLSNSESAFLLTHFKVKKRFDRWYNQRKEIREGKIFDYKTINARFRALNKPFNCYCKKDYIDYNCVVDKIIFECQPYGKEWQREISKSEFSMFNRMYKKASRKTKKLKEMGKGEDLTFANNSEMVNFNPFTPSNSDFDPSNSGNPINIAAARKFASNAPSVPRQRSKYSTSSNIFHTGGVSFGNNFQGLNLNMNPTDIINSSAHFDTFGNQVQQINPMESIGKNKSNDGQFFTPFFSSEQSGNSMSGIRKENSEMYPGVANMTFPDMGTFNMNYGPNINQPRNFGPNTSGFMEGQMGSSLFKSNSFGNEKQ